MTPLRIAIILLLPVIQTVLLILGISFQHSFFYSIVGGFIVSDVLLALFFKKSISRSHILWFALPSLLLYGGSASALFVLEESYLIKSILIAHLFLQWLYFINLYYHLYRNQKYQERSFWNISLSVHIVSFFNFAIALYGLVYFVDYSLFLLIIPFGAICAIAYAQQLVVHKMDVVKHWIFCSIQSFILIECALVINLLPSPYLTKAFLLSIPFFIVSKLGYSSLRKELHSRAVLFTVLLAEGVLLLVILTTRWR